jgi:hypothetical protein
VASAGRFLERPLFAGRRSEAAMTFEPRDVSQRRRIGEQAGPEIPNLKRKLLGFRSEQPRQRS